jgi:hypothetical protein
MPDSQDPASADDSEQSSQPPPGPPSGGATQEFSLNRRQDAVASELDRLDPQLGGLFRLGLELAARGDTPGLSYLIAEAGRELNVGVIKALAADAPALSAEALATIAENDDYRGPIARAIRLDPQHPLVSAWAEMHRRFNSEVHLVPLRSTPSSAASDFAALAELLLGRLAPYFNAQDEADALLAIDAPGREHISALRGVLVRPALRTYFLRSLHNPRWLTVLQEIDAFNSPPSRAVHPDGSWSMVTWLEGEYLVKIAGSEPDRVSDILLTVPRTNDNPAVWDALARAAVALPPDQAAKILSHIMVGVRSLPWIALPTALLRLGVHVAPVDAKVAIELLNTFFWLRRAPPSGEKDDGASGRMTSGRYALSTAWLLERVDPHDAQDILDELVPAIPPDAKRSLAEMLGRKVISAIKSVDPEFDKDAPRMSSLWCRELDGSDDRSDVRCMLLRAFAKTLVDLAARNEPDAAWVVAHLDKLPAGLKTRLRYYVASRSAPHLRDEVNALLTDPNLLEWALPGREVGELLRNRFEDADMQSQAAFAELLSRGPSEEGIAHYAEWASNVGRDAGRPAAIAYWQAKHLRRFGAKLPTSLQPLAERIGFIPVPLNPEDIGLTEDGWYSGGASWVGEVSPITTEELRDLTPEKLAEKIANWVPTSGMDAPTLRGLDDALESATFDNPEHGVSVADAILAGTESPRGLAGVLRGLRRAAREDKSLPWGSMAAFMSKVLRLFPDAAASEWAQVRTSAIDLIDDSVAKMPAEFLEEITTAVEELIRHPTTWEDASEIETTSMDGVLNAALNTTGGRATEALIRISLRAYNAPTSPGESAEAADKRRQAVGDRLHELVALVLDKAGRSALGARATLGTFLPQLVWFAPAWWSSRASELVGDGVLDPTGNPIWSAYLARGQYFDQTFLALRPWYASAAKGAAGRETTARDRTWEPERHLVEHALIAIVRGRAVLGEADAFVENAVNNVPVDDRAHAYWSIFRGWSDAKEKGQTVTSDFSTRLIQFWDWRIGQLERHEEWADRNEEADGLLWFCLTPFLPAPEVIRLGTRTLAIAKGERGTLHSLWKRIAELSVADPDGAFRMLEQAVELELNSPWPMFQVTELEPIFTNALSHGSADTRAAAIALLNRLGDAGFSEFGRLRPPAP